jgi:glycosyltransferase involved in cell wall biosynthesis
MVKILVVGQTPPPFGGQAIMIEKLLGGEYNNIEFYHIRMSFSKKMSDIGHFQIGKVFHLIYIIFSIIWNKLIHKIDVMYYPPAGPDKVALYRDYVILIISRRFFRHIIFHFHAGGISDFIEKLSPIHRWLAKIAFHDADCTIRISKLNPEDGKNFFSKNDVIIPNGIEDQYRLFNHVEKKDNKIPIILFVSVLSAEKGVNILLEACYILKNKGHQFKLKIMGSFSSREYEKIVMDKIISYNLSNDISFIGVKTGTEKWRTYHSADIFCFPTYFESETFGLVNLEAMQFRLPIVSTRWRGIPSLIEDGVNGYLVDIKDSISIAKKLEILLNDPNKRLSMGKQGREIYLKDYKSDKWHSRMERMFIDTIS